MKNLEEIIIGSLIQEPQLIKLAVKLIEPDDFYERELNIIYLALLDMHSKSEAIDLMTVTVNVVQDKISPSYVSKLLTRVGSTDHIKEHLLKLKEVSTRNKLKTTCRVLQERSRRKQGCV